MRRPYVYALAGLSLCGAAGAGYNAWQRFNHPFPPSMMADAWYDQLVGMIGDLAIVVACLHYDRRRYRKGARPLTNRWADKIELRGVLYCFAGLMFLALPSGLVKEYQALHDPSPPFQNTFISAFPGSGLFAAAVGFAIIFYDRRRVRREIRLDENLCAECG